MPQQYSFARGVLTGLAVLALPGPAAHGGPGPAAVRTGPVVESFPSGGRRVCVERFLPRSGGKHPAVVLLHGLDGLRGKHYRTIAARLACRGYVALLVHYFDRTATKEEDLPAIFTQFRASLVSGAHPGGKQCSLRGTFEAWVEAVRDAAAHARSCPGVDPDRIGLLGFSMGGFLAFCAAADADARVACVAQLFGGLPPHLGRQLRRQPPTLIVHGDKDQVVPVRHAHVLHKELLARKCVCELRVYEGAGHCFLTPEGKLEWLPALDAERHTLGFLRKHLVGAGVALKASGQCRQERR